MVSLLPEKFGPFANLAYFIDENADPASSESGCSKASPRSWRVRRVHQVLVDGFTSTSGIIGGATRTSPR